MRDGERLPPNRSQATNANPKIPAIDAAISAVTATCLDISRPIPWASQAATIVVRIVVPALVMAHAIVFSNELLRVTKKPETQCAMASGRSAPHQSHIDLACDKGEDAAGCNKKSKPKKASKQPKADQGHRASPLAAHSVDVEQRRSAPALAECIAFRAR